MPNKLPALPVWGRWKELTQFLILTDHVLLSQEEQWNALPLANKENITIVRQNGPYKFETTGSVYQTILSDRHVLASLVLFNSYALIESHVKEVYGVLMPIPTVSTPNLVALRSGALDLEGLISRGGIETWGTNILTDLGRNWGAVEMGQAGLVEAAVVRNAVAHGELSVTQSMVNRVAAAGGTLPWPVGAQIKLDIPRMREYRHRLRSFSRVVEHGANVML